jgi:hypothetical protein
MEDGVSIIGKRQKRLWLCVDVVLFGIYFLAGLIVLDPTGLFGYLDGLRDTHIRWFIFVCMLYLWPITIAFLAILLIRLYFWRRYFTGRLKYSITLSFMLVLMALFNPFFSLITFFPFVEPGYKPFTQGFYDRMQTHLQVEPIRGWMATLEDDVYDGQLYGYEFDSYPFELPEEITALSSEISYIKLYNDEALRRCLHLEWGGPLVGRWGVVIGPKDMPIPQTVYPTEEERIGEYRLRFEDGVYVWHLLK